MEANPFEALSAWALANPVVAPLVIVGVGALAIAVTLAAMGLRGAGEAAPPELPAERPPEPAPGAEPELVIEPEPAPMAEPAPVIEPAPEPTRMAEPETVAEPAAVIEPVSPPMAEPAPAAEPEPAPVVEPAPPPVRLAERLRRTRESLVGRVAQVMGGRTVDAEVLEELEALLLGADLGVRTADALLEEVRRGARGADAEGVRAVLQRAILERLRKVETGDALAGQGSPHVILVLGVNGTGKTTTIGKLAARYAAAGRKVILGAGDTFRAAAGEQLQIWGERVGCEVIVGPSGGDPAAVAFDTVKAARARGADVAIVDTAGRLQTKKPLMEELGKIVRVIGREHEGAPHETLLVLDANTGQNAISQARLFTEVAGVTGIVLTKLDGTAKGGVIVGLADEFGIPVRYVGVGESIEDLRDFSAEEFVEALFEE